MIVSRPIPAWVGALARPIEIGDRKLPSPVLVVLATIGAVFLVTLAAVRWAAPSDETAYWLAARRLLEGQPLYEPGAWSQTPYAYWYPPIVAQVLAPVAAVLPSLAFTVAWTVLLLACLWWLADGDPLLALAFVALPPVMSELWNRNVHLVLAVLLVLAIRDRTWLFSFGATIKLSPGLGIPWAVMRGRWRDAAIATGVGLAILLVSVVISPDVWRQFFDMLRARGPGDVAGIVPVPYIVRAIAGLALALLAGRLLPRLGDPLLVVAVTVAMPTLWLNALSTLLAIVPLVRAQWMARPEPRPLTVGGDRLA